MDIEKVDIQKDIDARIKLFRRRLKDLIDTTSERTKKTEAKQAQEMGTNKNNLSRYCSDIDADKERPIPKIDQLVRFANYYNVSTDYLLGYTDAEQPVTTDEGQQIRTACEYTGLSERAVRAIHGSSREIGNGGRFLLDFGHRERTALDIMLSSRLNSLLFRYFYCYLYSENAEIINDSMQYMIGLPKGQEDVHTTDYLTFRITGDIGTMYESRFIEDDFWDSLFTLSFEKIMQEIKKDFVMKHQINKS